MTVSVLVLMMCRNVITKAKWSPLSIVCKLQGRELLPTSSQSETGSLEPKYLSRNSRVYCVSNVHKFYKT